MDEQARVKELESVVALLLDELDVRGRIDHQSLAVRALIALGLSTPEIRQWFQGEIILNH